MFVDNTKFLAKTNRDFRRVLYTGEHSQVVAMSLPVGGDIGEEVHPDTDQIFLIVDGDGEAKVGAATTGVTVDDLVFVPAGELHNIGNTSDRDLKLLTIYSPPAHADGLVQAAKRS